MAYKTVQFNLVDRLFLTGPPIGYNEFIDFQKICQGEFVAAPAEDAIVVGETVFFEVYNPNPVSGMGFFVKDCTVSDNEGRSHDIISDNCADRATASSYYTDKGMRLMLCSHWQLASTRGSNCCSKKCSQMNFGQNSSKALNSVKHFSVPRMDPTYYE